MTEDGIKTQIDQYKARRPMYEAFVENLHTLLNQLLKTNGLDFVTIESRAKTVESFEDKIQRPDKDYVDPINELTDLAGLRIVAYQLADVDAISSIVRESFEIDKENSVDKTKILEADRFGYLSIHYVITLDSKRAELPENKGFAYSYSSGK